MINRITRLRVPVYFRVFLAWFSFLVALDASIALNRWWLGGGFEAYLQNVVLMVGGFVVFVVLFSESRFEMVGNVFLCVAVHFIGNYEIGGPSKLYLTPLDPILAVGPAFTHGPASIAYRKGMATGMSVLAALTLAISKLKTRGRNE